MMSKNAIRVTAAAMAVVLVLALAGWWASTRAGAMAPGRGTTGERHRVPVPVVATGHGQAKDEPMGQFPPAEYPAIATERLIRVSLGLLAKNGEDLTKPMPSRHRVLAASPAVVEELTAWGRSAGFEPTMPVRYHDHGGEEHFQLDLVRTGVPEPQVIEAQGRQVFAAVAQIPGAYYQSWMGGHAR